MTLGLPIVSSVSTIPRWDCDACGARAVVQIDTEDGESRDATRAYLCREHAREHARAVLRIVHDVPEPVRPAKGAV